MSGKLYYIKKTVRVLVYNIGPWFCKIGTRVYKHVLNSAAVDVSIIRGPSSCSIANCYSQPEQFGSQAECRAHKMPPQKCAELAFSSATTVCIRGFVPFCSHSKRFDFFYSTRTIALATAAKLAVCDII